MVECPPAANRVQKLLYDITTKYASVVKFEITPELFEPQCIIKLEASGAEGRFEALAKELEGKGFAIQLTRVKKNDRESDEVLSTLPPTDLLYNLIYMPAREVDVSEIRQKKEKKISLLTIAITGVFVALSAWFYFDCLEPLFGYANNSPIQNVLNTVWFVMGMVLIILCHELGHKISSEKNHIPASPPYLIPGPPPIGIFGAFVSIKRKMGTRTKMFDIALGGIAGGLIISVILIIIGYAFSVQVSTVDYLNLRVAMAKAARLPDPTFSGQVEYLHDHLNCFSFGMLGIQTLFFPSRVTFQQIGGYSLPTQLIILHPLAYAGWIGLLTSGLNLVPLTFLDGGHIFRAMFPQRYGSILGVAVGIALYAFISQYLVLIAIFSINGTLNELMRETLDTRDVCYPFVPLQKSRYYIGFLLILILVLTFPLSGEALISPVSY